MHERVIVLTEADLHWEFGDQGPTVRLDRLEAREDAVRADAYYDDVSGIRWAR